MWKVSHYAVFMALILLGPREAFSWCKEKCDKGAGVCVKVCGQGPGCRSRCITVPARPRGKKLCVRACRGEKETAKAMMMKPNMMMMMKKPTRKPTRKVTGTGTFTWAFFFVRVASPTTSQWNSKNLTFPRRSFPFVHTALQSPPLVVLIIYSQ